MDVTRKLAVLADAAKYDASCASSGAPRRSSRGKAGLGNSNGTGICHSYTPDAGEGPAPRVPAALVAALRQAAPYRVAGRWNLLYRVLWRGVHGERQAHLPGDQDGSALQRRIKAVQREAHHLHAFLRFQPVADDDPQRPLDLLAWFEPAHDILPWASEHFADRLGRRRWLIATPLDGVWYDGQRSHYHAPCPARRCGRRNRRVRRHRPVR